MDAQSLVVFEDWIISFLNVPNERRHDDSNDARNAILPYIMTLKQVVADIGVYLATILDANVRMSKLLERTQRKLWLISQSRDVVRVLLRWQRQSDDDLRKELVQMRKELDERREDREEQKRDIEALEDSVQILEEDRDELFSINMRSKKELNDLQARLTEQEIQDWVNTTEIEIVRGQNASLKREIGELREKLADKQIENAVVEEEFRKWQAERAKYLMLIHTLRIEKSVLAEDNIALEETINTAGRGMDRMNGLKWEFLRYMGKA